MKSSKPPAGQPLSSATSSIAAPFTQAWIQALTLAAEHPLARTIKPMLELVNTLSRTRAEADRELAAQELWEVAHRDGLGELLHLLPVYRSRWSFSSDQTFLYRRRDAASDLAEVESGVQAGQSVAAAAAMASDNFDSWLQAIGLRSLELPLTAEVFSGDWASLVRSEAVRLQQSLSLSAVPQATTLQLPCTARWDTHRWSITFDQVEWIVISLEDVPVMSRPSYVELEERVTWLVAAANDNLVSKRAANCKFEAEPAAWEQCVASLQPLHASLRGQASSFSPWLMRTWYCVWPIVYREHHVLRELADIGVLRRELKECLSAQPQLCLWMFLYAKLICQTQLTTGLGFCADFGD